MRAIMGYFVFFFACAGLLAPDQALAYFGPGSGLSAFGSLFAVLAAIFFGLVGFVWYPMKRLMRLIRAQLKSSGK